MTPSSALPPVHKQPQRTTALICLQVAEPGLLEPLSGSASLLEQLVSMHIKDVMQTKDLKESWQS